MTDETASERKAGLVLQGGGALGAFELGVARAVYHRDSHFEPDVISGVSIGTINAVLLARPAQGLTGLQALEQFWREVAVNPWLALWFGAAASTFGVPGFYSPDLPWLPSLMSLYDVKPLVATLERLVDSEALKDRTAAPQLLLGAINIETGKPVVFDSLKTSLELKHVLASASLPPSFPGVEVDGQIHWDGGVFDNTPLGAVIEALGAPKPQVMVVNLFPNENPRPQSLAEVSQVLTNLLFANKTDTDIKLMEKFNIVAEFMDKLEKELPAESKLRGSDEYKALRGYRRVPKIMNVNRTSTAKTMESSDFSQAGIEARAAEGERLARQALADVALLALKPAKTASSGLS